jgi:hypothetical protein
MPTRLGFGFVTGTRVARDTYQVTDADAVSAWASSRTSAEAYPGLGNVDLGRRCRPVYRIDHLRSRQEVLVMA